jgi:AraC-like DNA-binding protein
MFEYSHRECQSRRAGNRSSRRVPEHCPRTNDVVVVTMLEPSLRAMIDAATDRAFANVHVNSASEALAAMRNQSTGALLLSPCIVRQQSLSEIERLVVKSPGVTVVAIMDEDCADTRGALLALGACGVRYVVNLAQRDGWNQLRALVDQAGGECRQHILGAVLSALDGATDETRSFFATLVRVAPSASNVKVFAGTLGVVPSTLMSRFFRVSLPSPKAYLAMTRLLYAASFFEAPRVSIADVANRLGYSSPQSFGRHVRTLLGLTVGEYRREYSLAAALDHYVARLIVPYSGTLRTFRPLDHVPISPVSCQQQHASPVAFAVGA